jgi:hypothetical protein
MTNLTNLTQYANLIQFPLAGQAMAIGYNLPSLNASDPPLVYARPTSIY